MRDNLSDAKDFRRFYESYEEVLKIFDEVGRVNMDRKQATLVIFSSIKGMC
jgi:hypothetical protein